MNIRNKFNLELNNLKIELGTITKIMGIVNATPDSFSNDGLLKKRSRNTFSRKDYSICAHNAVKHARKLIEDGADIIDIGGESTRPGADKVSAEEEIKRVIPAIEVLNQLHKIPISIDTYKAIVAKHALDAGASIVNNIMGTSLNKSLLKMIRNYNACIVLMHIQGTPKTMQKNIKYNNLITNIIDELNKSIEICLEFGIKSDKIIIDPGIGFGKTVEDNLSIIKNLNKFKRLKKPILIGTSRKSFIGKLLNLDTNERLIGTQAANSASIFNGAHIIRVHDVKEARQTAIITDAIINQKA